jgi:hypothetical protein
MVLLAMWRFEVHERSLTSQDATLSGKAAKAAMFGKKRELRLQCVNDMHAVWQEAGDTDDVFERLRANQGEDVPFLIRSLLPCLCRVSGVPLPALPLLSSAKPSVKGLKLALQQTGASSLSDCLSVSGCQQQCRRISG